MKEHPFQGEFDARVPQKKFVGKERGAIVENGGGKVKGRE